MPVASVSKGEERTYGDGGTAHAVDRDGFTPQSIDRCHTSPSMLAWSVIVHPSGLP
jgi:hypothetical protein